MMKKITENDIKNFERELRDNEKSNATIEKYSAVLRRLMGWLGGESVNKERLIAFRKDMLKTLSTGTVNSFILRQRLRS